MTVLESLIYSYHQLIDVSSARRSLSSSIEEKQVSGAYKFFFALSQLGGLYAFLIIVLGFFLRPVYDRLFQQDAINILNLKNKYNFDKFEIEKRHKYLMIKPEEFKNQVESTPERKKFSKSEGAFVTKALLLSRVRRCCL